MSKEVISVRDVTKKYTLYPDPWSRVREVLFKASKKKEYPEHYALRGVSLSVNAGERVGLIGRNGAGKSTLLKIITGVTRPTQGEVHVTGKTHALLQMGASFNHEFTGRQNVEAYLAGLPGAPNDTSDLIADIIEFTELDEYIDQPFKTYSTGMQMRLIFGASTAIAPELFVVDEVLSVGDAYFQQKSFERIKDLCETNNSTLLLVSHDVYTASKMVDRMIWVERGAIVFDGSPEEAVNLYEESIKEQEEERLSRRNRHLLQASDASQKVSEKADQLVELKINFEKSFPLKHPLYLGDIKIAWLDKIKELRIADQDVVEEFYFAQDQAWGDVVSMNDRAARPILNYGSILRTASVFFKVSKPEVEELITAMPRLSADCLQNQNIDLSVSLSFQDSRYIAGDISIRESGEWGICDTVLAVADTHVRETKNLTQRYGTNDVALERIVTVNHDGQETFRFEYGSSIYFKLSYSLNDVTLSGPLEMMINIYANGITEVGRFFLREIEAKELIDKGGELFIKLSDMLLPRGSYTVSVLLARQGYYDNEFEKFYTINDKVVSSLSRKLEFEVFGGGRLAMGQSPLSVLQLTEKL